MKIAIITSTGGSIFRKSLEILRRTGSQVEFIMVTDRECEAEKIAKEYGLVLKRIEEKDNQKFSIQCMEYLKQIGGVDAAVTFFKRLITLELINAYPCVNIHPALLPAFRGFGAVEHAYQEGVRFIGGTLHMVDEFMDHGPIIAQIQAPIPPNIQLKDLIHMTYLQDIYLFLLLVDLMETEAIKVMPGSKYSVLKELSWNDRCNPCMNNQQYLEKLSELQGNYNVYP